MRTSDVFTTAFPQPADRSDYAAAAGELESALAALPGFVAVYGTGSVSVPGISDLDRIAVVKGGQRVPEVWPRLSERTRQLAMHTPFLVDRVTFEAHRRFAFLDPLEHLVGRALDAEPRPVPDYSEPLIGAESLLMCLLRAAKQQLTGRLKVRPALCELNNVRHGLALARLDRAEAPAAWRLADDVAALRGSWFTLPEPERIAQVKGVAGAAVPALREALWALGEQRAGAAAAAPAAVTLGPPWSNVTLVRAEAPAGLGRPRLRFPASARASELRWRMSRLRIAIHGGAISLISGSGDDGSAQFRSERDELVRRYRSFLATDARGYSGIGFAPSLTPPG